MKLSSPLSNAVYLFVLFCLVVPPLAAQEPSFKPAEEKTYPRDSAVEALLASKPTTPVECVRAAKIFAELGRPDLGKPLLKNVLDAALDRAELAELGRAVGPAMLIELAGRNDLQPEARKLADAVSAAIRAENEDVRRIDALIQQLQDTSAEVRLRALVGLREAQAAAVPRLIAVSADPGRAKEHANVRAALAEIGAAAIGPLTAVVGRADPKLAVQAIKTLAAMKDGKPRLCLLAPCLSEDGPAEVRAAAAEALRRTGGVPTKTKAIAVLTAAAEECLNRGQPVEGVQDGKVKVWRWDESKRQCESQTVSPADAALMQAARWARDAYSLAPHDRQLRLLHLTAMLEAAARENGRDRPLDEKNMAFVEAKRFGVEPLEEVVAYGMERGHPAAATVAARLLGEIGAADELLDGPKPGPLAAALQSPDRRLRLAAAAAIVRLQPVRQFAGSSRVPDVLAFFASSRGLRCALVASSKPETARDLAGRLAAAGFQSDAVATGRELLLRVAQSPDCELALIDVTIAGPTADLLLQQLRNDPRTASLRIGLIAPADRYEQAERIARNDPLAAAFPRPRDEQAFNWQLERLAELSARDFVGFEARQRQAVEALGLLAALAGTSEKLYDLRRTEAAVTEALANQNPAVAARAADVLAELNSPAAQRALVETASRFTRPLALRQHAVKAFRRSAEKHGLLLTAKEIQRQYDLYNNNEHRDAASQRVLSLILDCIEAARPVSVQNEKQRF
ncbi:MAG: hypothetical protein JW959_01815 [Pirellulales bacterium]|nr:hypothetical protein [Pirellulales bacterium]